MDDSFGAGTFQLVIRGLTQDGSWSAVLKDGGLAASGGTGAYAPVNERILIPFRCEGNPGVLDLVLQDGVLSGKYVIAFGCTALTAGVATLRKL